MMTKAENRLIGAAREANAIAKMGGVQEAAQVLLMAENMETLADVAKRFKISEPAFFGALRELAIGQDDD